MKISTLDIEVSVMKYFEPRKNIVVPNITHINGLVSFETDIVVLSRSGYATGVEIKVSRSDLRADLNKAQWKDAHTAYSHNQWFKRFKYFYYAVPHYLTEAALAQIPEWCGLIEFSFNKDYCYSDTVRLPQRLFNTKWSDCEILKLARLGALRVPNLKEKINECLKSNK